MVAGGLLASGGIMTTFRPMALLLAVLAASLSIAVWTAPSRAQASVTSALTVLHASASPLVPEHSSALGALEPAADVHLDVTLKLPDPSEVSTFIASLSDRSSPNFRHFLRPGQFGHLFGPSLTEVAAVDAVLRAPRAPPRTSELQPSLDPGDGAGLGGRPRLSCEPAQIPAARRARRLHDAVGTEHLGISGR